MREIKFRGQRVDNGEWVIGYYGKRCIDTIDNLITTIQAIDSLFDIKVHPETVGQYTGLKDKNGKEACEGDIVKFREHDYLAEIKYYPEHAAFLFDSHDPETRNNPDAYMLWSDDFEIIGNTTEHPELMDK